MDLQGFSTLTPVQETAITKAIQGHDLMVASKTGSGKTLAFLVPVINRLLTQKALSKQDPRALILAPTRELAKQVFGVAKKLIQSTKLNASLVVGGENFNTQAKQLRRNPHIIVATAGRMADHLEAKHLFLNGLELLVLDEADRMLELGFHQQLKLINEQANHRKRQTMMFSATMDSADISQLTFILLKDPQRIEVDQASTPHVDISLSFYFADHVEHKDKLLLALSQLEGRAQALVFTATREDTLRLSELLNEHGHESAYLHGEMLQNQRNAVLADFINNKKNILVTTDLASRGLDIRNVSLVINYDLPKLVDEYIHRIGRTGRAGDTGSAISLVGKKDWWSLCAIEERLGQSFTFSTVEGLKAKFKGFTTKPNSKSKNKPQKAIIKKTISLAQNKPKKKNAKRETPMQDVGHIPIKKR